MSWMKLLEPLLPFLIIEFERPDKVWFMKTLTNRIISVPSEPCVSADLQLERICCRLGFWAQLTAFLC